MPETVEIKHKFNVGDDCMLTRKINPALKGAAKKKAEEEATPKKVKIVELQQFNPHFDEKGKLLNAPMYVVDNSSWSKLKKKSRMILTNICEKDLKGVK